MKLLIRGGSIAAGHGVKKCYADILEESLLKKGVEVINRSRYKETSFDGIGTFDEDIAHFAPDILLINFGVDDAFGYVYRSEFQDNLVLSDARYPNERGHQVIAEEMMTRLSKILDHPTLSS